MQASIQWFPNSKRDFKVKARGNYIKRLIAFKYMNRRYYGQVHIQCISYQSAITMFLVSFKYIAQLPLNLVVWTKKTLIFIDKNHFIKQGYCNLVLMFIPLLSLISLQIRKKPNIPSQSGQYGTVFQQALDLLQVLPGVY